MSKNLSMLCPFCCEIFPLAHSPKSQPELSHISFSSWSHCLQKPAHHEDSSTIVGGPLGRRHGIVPQYH
ncbi:hypothetical protein BDR04DRAFT_472677 [Suillus decipiens]|nr:hypothetical protein BDR04DRAFT_472677 [Suillus decipiens]